MNNTESRDMLLELEQCRDDVNEWLEATFRTGKESCGKLLESMRYSLFVGGKRIRPVICVKFCEAAGGKPEDARSAACAIEMIHTYSLIHDDLPCMDDSNMRRGRLTNHIKYGEFTATLAGDALQAAAFQVLMGAELPPGAVVDMGRVLADAAGCNGICGGQIMDMQGSANILTSDVLTEITSRKTSALISAAARTGVIAAGGSPEQIKAAGEYAQAVGLAFQVRDDVLDRTAIQKELGKPVGADIVNDKATFAMLLGLEKCEELISAQTSKAVDALDGLFGDASFLTWLARYLADRKT